MNRDYLPLKRKGPLYIINGEPVSEKEFREQEAIFRYKETQCKQVAQNKRIELNESIVNAISNINNPRIIEEYKKILNLPDSTYEELNRKIFLFNDGELRYEEEIDDYDNNKIRQDFIFSNSFTEYCKEHSARPYPLIPLILNLIIGAKQPVAFLGIFITLPITLLLAAKEKKRVAELHIDYGLSKGLNVNDPRIQKEQQSIAEARQEKIASVTMLTSLAINSKRTVDYIKDPDKWHQI